MRQEKERTLPLPGLGGDVSTVAVVARKTRRSVQWQDDEQSAKRRQEAIQRIVGEAPQPTADPTQTPHRGFDTGQPEEEGQGAT
jgi:hypothetical protein